MTTRPINQNNSVARIAKEPLQGSPSPTDYNNIFTENTPQIHEIERPFYASFFEIPIGFLNCLKDEEWMALLSELFGVASHVCSLTGTAASEFIPYISILSSPIYLYHAIKQSQERFKFMVCGFKAKRIGDAIFWGGSALGSMGGALSDIIKPFTGGMVLFGLTGVAITGFAFSNILPVVLIAFSAIGGLSQGWGLMRTAHHFHKLRQRTESLDGSLRSLENILPLLRGPKLKTTPYTAVEAANYELEQKHFSQSYFTYDERQEEMKNRIEALLGFNDTSEMRALQETVNEILPLIKKGNEILEKIDPIHSLFQQVEEALSLCSHLISVVEGCQTIGADSQLVKRLEGNYKRILRLKKILYAEGVSITESFKSEMARKLTSEVLSILSSATNFAAGILFLAFPQHQLVAYILSLTSSGLGVSNITLSKVLRHFNYLQTENFINLVRSTKRARNQIFLSEEADGTLALRKKQNLNKSPLNTKRSLTI